MAYAYKKGSDEASELNESIILTGNYAGTSAGQLAAMAASLAKVNGTRYEAVAALSEITSTGKFTVEQIEQVGTTAIAMQEATGKAVSETVAEFSKLADDPVKASQQLNDRYHYLTASVYEQITALERQGDTLGAAQFAMDAYSQAMDERANQIVENLGTMERAWRTVGDIAKVHGTRCSAWAARKRLKSVWSN
ncbi:phage tail length tape measure family protein [Pseudomonas aeruginosa]|nr:phage tail length tape measure family protein [Pseudomonas aeruginosa]MDF5884980.1 phage tail length tape measure family protein [Pseudomonas aeruginosa]